MRALRLSVLFATTVIATSCVEDPTTGPGTTCAGIDLQTSHENCGTCGHPCAANETCSAGSCTAAVTCAGLDLTTNHDNCGKCGQACAPAEACVDSKCAICGGVDLQTTHDHCGTCDTKCGATETCVAGKCELPPLTISFVQPDEGAQVYRKFHVKLGLVATGPVDSITLTIPSSDPPFAPVTFTAEGLEKDVEALGTGPTELVATVKQGDREVTAKRTVEVTDPIGHVTGFKGFYLGAEDAKGCVTFDAPYVATGVSMRVLDTEATLLELTAKEGGFCGTIAAEKLGRGDVTLEFVASDGAGHAGFAESALTVAWLHDTSCLNCPALLRSVTTPGGIAIVHLANSVAEVPEQVEADAELRVTYTNGGSTTTLAQGVCPQVAEAETVVSANGSRIAFSAKMTALPSSVNGALSPCRRLLTSPLPPVGAGPTELSLEFDGTVAVSLDGSVVLWAERVVNGDRTWKAIGPTGAAFTVPLGESPEQLIPMTGAIVVVDRNGPQSPTIVIRGDGYEAMTTVDGDGNAQDVQLTGEQRFTVISDTGRSLAARSVMYGGEVNPPIWYHVDWDHAKFACESGDNCEVVASEHPILQLQGDAFVMEIRNFSPTQNEVRYLDPVDESTSLVAPGSLESNNARPRDASAAYVLTDDNRVLLVPPNGMVQTLGSALNDFKFATGLNLTETQRLRGGRFILNAPRGYTPFETDITLSGDDGHLRFQPFGQPPVNLDSTAFPFNFAPVLLLAGESRLIFRTNTSEANEPGAIWSFGFSQTPATRVTPAGEPNAVGVLPPWQGRDGSATHLRGSAKFAFVVGTGSAARLFVANTDGTGVAQIKGATGAAAPVPSAPFGIEPGGTTAWWYDGTEHVRVSTLTATTSVQLPTFASEPIAVLKGGIVVGYSDQNDQREWGWASSASPAFTPIGRWGGDEGLVVPDHHDFAILRTGDDGAPVWRIDAAGVARVGEGDENFAVLQSGYVLAYGGSGSLFVAGLRADDGAGVQLEPGGSEAVVDDYDDRAGGSLPNASSFAPPTDRRGGDNLEIGATPRNTLTYAVSGGARAGWYAWSVRDVLEPPPQPE